MLRRIGTHKATVFAVLDLTQGYHQAPRTLAARVYTAFILFCGVYQFTSNNMIDFPQEYTPEATMSVTHVLVI